MPIVCPITDGGDLAGIGIFNADVDLVKSIMDQDPAVKEGILVYEAHLAPGYFFIEPQLITRSDVVFLQLVGCGAPTAGDV